MSTTGQTITKAVYEDPEIVENYIQRNALVPKQAPMVREFAKTITGNQVLDLGCGPGHDTYLFAELGFNVTGFDYSAEMIRRAQSLREINPKPTFVVGDMRHLSDYFTANTFDAIWASASLLHIEPSDLPCTIQGMTDCAKDGAVIYVSLKGGQGTVLVDEDKLGKPMQREFTLWDKDSFVAFVKPYGWHLTDTKDGTGSLFRGQPTQWLHFFFKITKYL